MAVVGEEGGGYAIMGQRAFLSSSRLGIGLFTERGMDDYLI